MPVLPGAESFAHHGCSDVGVLLCHGFTGTPASMRPWGRHLADAGFTISCPRLPGHGTTWRELSRTRWTDWYACARREVVALLERCESVFVFGQSMGGTLTLRLAQEFGERISGIALVNPSVTTARWKSLLLPVLAPVVPSIRGLGGDIAKAGAKELSYARVPLPAAASLMRLWRLVRADLPMVTQPTLLMHSVEDHVVEPVNSRIVADGIRSAALTDIALHSSFHVATLDNDAPLIFDHSVAFIRTHQQVAAS